MLSECDILSRIERMAIEGREGGEGGVPAVLTTVLTCHCGSLSVPLLRDTTGAAAAASSSRRSQSNISLSASQIY